MVSKLSLINSGTAITVSKNCYDNYLLKYCYINVSTCLKHIIT